MNIEVEMYVRTYGGEIHKILDTKMEIYFRFDTGINVPFLHNGNTRNNITKASFNIIDLIEIGDYVNGLAVTRICIDKETNTKYLNMYGSISEWENNDIKSIVTKEQFEREVYKI